MESPVHEAGQNRGLMGNAFGATRMLSLVYLALALACLIKWGAPNPWSRIDVFSGSYLVLRALGTIHSIAISRSVFRSKQVLRECWGMTSDPGGVRWVVLLMMADLTVFLDYGHWRVVPVLQRPALQGLGVGLYVFVAILQIWTDTHLTRYFGGERPAQVPIEQGPFRYVRHPRYAAGMMGKAAFALTFASLLGWLLALAWMLLLLRNVRAEEAHLLELFGERYQTYARKTPRLLPGIY